VSGNGCFITFEGGEGAGKTTQINLLAAKLGEMGRTVVITREPGGTPLGNRIRRELVCITDDEPSPRAELLLYEADRAHHVEKVILPALEAGSVVLCDRYADATLAYQGWGRGLDQQLITELNRAATGGLSPARTLWLDLDPEEGVSRSLKREACSGEEPEARFEREEALFHHRVREGYRAIMEAEPGRVRLVDAVGGVEEVFARVWAELEDLFACSEREGCR